VACQTLPTGDIVITRIFFTEEEKEWEKTLTSSPKKCPPSQQHSAYNYSVVDVRSPDSGSLFEPEQYFNKQ
jgi:hypothetical protein